MLALGSHADDHLVNGMFAYYTVSAPASPLVTPLKDVLPAAATGSAGNYDSATKPDKYGAVRNANVLLPVASGAAKITNQAVIIPPPPPSPPPMTLNPPPTPPPIMM